MLLVSLAKQSTLLLATVCLVALVTALVTAAVTTLVLVKTLWPDQKEA